MTVDPPTDMARPRDFDAGYGDGVTRGLCLGGGGLFFVAWQVAYLYGLARRDVRLSAAERVVGTSAGSVVSSVLVGGHLQRLHREISLLAGAPALLRALAPSSDLAPSQLRALGMFWEAGDAGPATVRAIGHAALAAATPHPARMRNSLALIIGRRRWPSPTLEVTCTDAYTGQRCVVTEAAQVPVTNAAAASSAVPGLFPPQPVGDRRCMDGGVGGSGTHLDLMAGAGRAVVLALSDGSAVTEAIMTIAPGDHEKELDQLRASGTDVLCRSPRSFDPDSLMSPAAVPEALAMGAAQAVEDAGELSRFWR